MKKIVIISNTLSSLFIFRSELINKLSELNYKIYLLSNGMKSKESKKN